MINVAKALVRTTEMLGGGFAPAAAPRASDLGQTPRVVLLTALLILGAGPAYAATITRGPYLQLVTTDSATVVWNTDAPASCAVRIGPLDGPEAIIAAAAGTVCAVRVDGLSPGVDYRYTPLADGLPLGAESVFRTDDPTAPFSFLVLGDTGCGCATQLAVRDAMQATPADFILHTGDVVYENGEAENYDSKFFVPYAGLLRTVVLWPSLGNHDIKTAGGAPWRDAFYTPANNAAGSEDYYSFDFGNAHVVVLDSNAATHPGSPQYEFLDQDLTASGAMWKFVAFHHTMYASGKHSSDLRVQGDLLPLIDAHGVDVVFMGHDHHYERTKPLRANTVVGEGEGTVYITTGAGGESVRPVGTSFFTAYAESAFHFTRVVVDGDWLVAQMIRVDGAVRDAVTLVKGAPPPPPACGDGFVNQPEEQCDGPDHAACPQGCDVDCLCVPICGDGQVEAPKEDCDGSADDACPGLCLSDCRCADPSRVVDLGPIADTYIEAGAEATWDHGAADHLDVDAQPSGITYLKFDLSAVTAPVRAATLTLFCSNASPDGGTVYTVADSSWPEGDRTGQNSASAEGLGLAWIDVDTNGDGAIDESDASPYVPDFARPWATLGEVISGQAYTVDVGAALQGGPGMYTLAIASNSSNGADYSSREHGSALQRPVLRLELEPDPECSSDADCDDGIACTVDRCDTTFGMCLYTPDHGFCDNGVFCDGAERCERGVGCRPAPAVDCDDGIACTSDACDERVQECVHAPDDASCDDGDACTIDTCDPAMGCRRSAAGCHVDLAPAADTYIEAGDEATWDHGAADHLDVDGRPLGITYLKFDLSAVTVPVRAATLTLFCTNGSPDGGTLYPVGSSSWREGDRTGEDSTSAAGSGLTWADVDTNNDGEIDARDTSPYVPDFGRRLTALGGVSSGQTRTIDVGLAFQAGPGLYTLAIKSDDGNGADYSSREHRSLLQRPLLRLELARPPCVGDADCDDGLLCTADACDPVAGCTNTPIRGCCSADADCDDGTVCNGSEICDLLTGQCGGGHPLVCDDGNACTTDTCDAVAGCRNAPVTDGASCADGNACNGAETCEGGVCVPGTVLVCDDGNACTTDTCDAVVGCRNVPVTDGASCADGNACNGAETCEGGVCVPGTVLVCDDGNVCTTDTCDGASGCRHIENGFCEPVTLEPIGDTYIERGTEATWDHGASDHLDVDKRPHGITYLKFDLGGVGGPVETATLTLYCTNASDDGGTVYPVVDSSWIEGSGNGTDADSAASPGLKWTDVDTNADGSIGQGDNSAYVPDRARAVALLGRVERGTLVSVDVTAALQDGPRTYTLAIESRSTNGATYSSREHPSFDQRPQLQLTFAANQL